MPRVRLDAETVTAAAADIVDTEGLGALTLTRLAAQLGVAPPSLYNHIDGLDDLRLRVGRSSIERLTGVLTEAALGRSRRDALYAIGGAWRCYAVRHPGLYALTQSAHAVESELAHDHIARAVAVLGAAVRSYDVPHDLATHAIRMVRSAFHGFADIEARGGFQMSAAVDRSYAMLVDALNDALERLSH